MSPSADAPPAVCCHGVSKAYGPAGQAPPAVRRASFEARSGEITFVTGPSGCGKTTLVSMIGGVLSPDDGEIEVFGRSLGGLGARELARFRAGVVGFIFQQLHLIPTLTARENVAVPLVVLGRRRREADEAAQAWLDRLGLPGLGDRHPRELSGGQQQRVAIARALVHDPRLVICDEPTAALDAETGRGVMEILRGQALKPGRAVLVVTHDPRILRPGDRIVSMDDGRIDRVATAA